jgi:hypothetical protein
VSRGVSLKPISTPFTPIRICERTRFAPTAFRSKPSYTSYSPSFYLRLKITCFKASLGSFSTRRPQCARFVETATRNALPMFYLPHLSSTNWIGTAVGVFINMVLRHLVLQPRFFHPCRRVSFSSPLSSTCAPHSLLLHSSAIIIQHLPSKVLSLFAL